MTAIRPHDRPRHAAVAGLALSALALSGCGSSDKSDSPGSSVGTTPTSTSASTSNTTSASSSSDAPTSSASAGPSSSGASASGASGSSQSAGSTMTAAQAKSSLTATSKASVVGVVRVGDGYEGASADASTMHFWRTDASGRWVADGSATRQPVMSSQFRQSIEGGKIRGSDHAVFVLHADIGGTGASPAAQVYARDAQGWGTVAPTKADGSAISLSRSGGDVGAWHNASLGADTLRLNTFVPGIANADGHDVVRSWVMKGGGFQLVGTDDPSTKPQHFTASALSRFTSPTGRNNCELSSRGVTCALSASVAASHGGAGVVTLTQAGWALGKGSVSGGGSGSASDWATTGGVTPGEVGGVRILGYGSTLTSGGFTCKSSRNGFECSNAAAGFTVSADGLTTHGTHAG